MTGIAPMQPADVGETAALFFQAFRKGQRPPAEFVDFFAACFFSSPAYDVGHGSLVHRDPEGAIDSALLVIPLSISANGRTLTARLMSSYMTQPGKPTRGGADLVLTIRARSQDLCFSDSATHVSVDHWRAVGGHVLPIQSLDFRRVFRPAAWLVARGRRRLPLWLAAVASALAPLADAVLRRALPDMPTAGASGAEITADEFASVAPGLVERFAVHPVWSKAELGWLIEMAQRNSVDGPLHFRELRDEKGHLCGATAYYARPGGVARVLNMQTRPRQECAVVTELLAHLDAMGCIAVQGIAQPFLMEALRRQKGVVFVPRGGLCISTRHADIVDAAQRGDFYLGGLAGEDWSRLVTDFHD